jgi:hypothetical protein
MEDLPGTYIDIDQDTFARAPSQVQVVNGQLKIIRWRKRQKITPGDTGTPCHPHDVAVVVDHEPLIKWSRKSHEHD